jgi:hypothetical protein
MAFRIGRVPKAVQQMQTLADQARQAGTYDEYLAALKTIYARLETDPLGWGDPEHHMKKEGGLMCHGVAKPLYVHFAVYEQEGVVIIVDIKSLPAPPPSSQ